VWPPVFTSFHLYSRHAEGPTKKESGAGDLDRKRWQGRTWSHGFDQILPFLGSWDTDNNNNNSDCNIYDDYNEKTLSTD
jgi:hypothetical protein